LENAIDPRGRYDAPDFDFSAAKNRIETVLREYGVALPRLRDDQALTTYEWSRAVSKDMGPLFIDFWKRFLHTTLGWSEARTMKWAERHKWWLTDGVVGHYYLGPAYFVVELVIPDQLRYRLEIDWLSVIDEVFRAIDDNGRCRQPDYDFAAAKAHVQKVLAKYDAALPHWDHDITDSEEAAKARAPCFLRFWANILGETLGWSHSDVLEWARQYEDDLEGRGNPFFFHEGPAFDITLLLIPERLKRSLPRYHLAQLNDRLLEVITSLRYESYRNYDFKAAKKLIEKVLAEYGGKLPE
jgi:hypothetical protein